MGVKVKAKENEGILLYKEILKGHPQQVREMRLQLRDGINARVAEEGRGELKVEMA